MILDEAKGRGWVFNNTGTCSFCGDDIEWWFSPARKSMPINPMNRGLDEFIFHTRTCTAQGGENVQRREPPPTLRRKHKA